MNDSLNNLPKNKKIKNEIDILIRKLLKSRIYFKEDEKIHKFTEGKGKAFSYFSIVAKNYLIIQNNANYAKMKARTSTDILDERRNISAEMALSDHQESLRDFTDLWVDWYDTHLNTIFVNKRDIIVADTILELFRIRENIENFKTESDNIINKK